MFVSIVRIGLLCDQPHADGRRQMVNLVRLGRQPPHEPLVGHGALRVAQAGVVSHGGQVFNRAGRFVIDDRHAIAPRQQRLDQMAADKPRSAGDQTMHYEKPRAEKLENIPGAIRNRPHAKARRRKGKEEGTNRFDTVHAFGRNRIEIEKKTILSPFPPN